MKLNFIPPEVGSPESVMERYPSVTRTLCAHGIDPKIAGLMMSDAIAYRTSREIEGLTVRMTGSGLEIIRPL